MIPNKLSGRGCQCQRLIKVKKIDNQLYARLRNHQAEKVTIDSPIKAASMPPSELNREQNGNGCYQKHNVVKPIS